MAAVQNARLETSCGVLEEGGTTQGGGEGESEGGKAQGDMVSVGKEKGEKGAKVRRGRKERRGRRGRRRRRGEEGQDGEEGEG